MNPRPNNLRRCLMIAMLGILLTGCETAAMLALNQVKITQFEVENDKLYVMGLLNSKSLGQFKQKLSENPNINTLVFTKCEGSIDDDTTFKLGRTIRERGLNTYLLHDSSIASGAVDLFLSGVDRTIEAGAKIGVHSWSDGSQEAKDIPKDNEDHRLNADYVKDMLGSEDFYWYTIYAADADSIFWMPESAIKQYGLATMWAAPTNDETPFGE